jgi:hypothetical protein
MRQACDRLRQRYQQTIRERLGPSWESAKLILCEAVMEDQHLTVDQCNELAEALHQDAADLPKGSEKANLLKLAHAYRDLASLKMLLSRKVN